MPLPQDLLVPDIMPLSLPEDSPVEVIVSAVVSTAHIFVQVSMISKFVSLGSRTLVWEGIVVCCGKGTCIKLKFSMANFS